MEKELTVNNISYRIVYLLGKGKGGYSSLAERDGRQVVIKQIHHEPCDYYTFGNKIEAELRDYERLQKACIRIPRMHDGLLWYVDYECNDYSEQWDFEHWGIQYWLPKVSFLGSCRTDLSNK